jgi:GST-like protein
VSKWSGTRKHLEEHRPQFYEVLTRIEAHPKLAPVLAQNWPKT